MPLKFRKATSAIGISHPINGAMESRVDAEPDVANNALRHRNHLTIYVRRTAVEGVGLPILTTGGLHYGEAATWPTPCETTLA